MSKKIDVNEYHEMRVQSDYWETEFNKKDKECTELKKQLAEKDKEIEDLKKEYNLCKAFYDLKCTEFDKLCYDYNKLRHQICEEIRKKARGKEYCGYNHETNEQNCLLLISEKLLDQIEKGNNNE